MLTLKTGLPGSYKSNSAVSELNRLHKFWSTEKGRAQRRIVFANINGLKLPHFPLPEVVHTKKDRYGVDITTYSINWDVVDEACADGTTAIVIIDEAQKYFPLRMAGDPVPAHVSWLNTHRHKGVDCVFITQAPKLIDVAVRRLIGKHQHYRRVFGWRRAVVYEHDQCDDGLQRYKTAITSQYSEDADANELYVSARTHTKTKFKKPWWIWLPVPLVCVALWAFPAAYSAMSNVITGKGVADVFKPAAASPLPGASAAGHKPAWLLEAEKNRGKPLISTEQGQEPARAAVAPVAARPASAPTGCMYAVARSRCTCFDDLSGKLSTAPVEVCEAQFPAGPAAALPDDKRPPQPVSEAEASALEFLGRVSGRSGIVPPAPW